MKIGSPADKLSPPQSTGTQAVNGETARTAPGAAAGAATLASVDASATVALSSTAATLLSGGNEAEFDAAKVARVSQAITDGSYKIDPAVIADKLIANAQELLAKVKG